MSIEITDYDLKVRWGEFNEQCHHNIKSRDDYWNNVNCKLGEFNATYDRESSIITFESEELYTMFILKWG